jgi:CRISPR-associated protein Csm2
LNIKASASRIRAETDADNSFKSKIIPQILMLKPLLANAKARHRRAITPLFEVINPLFDVVKDRDDYDRFCDFVEAIVAYHKYCGGKD